MSLVSEPEMGKRPRDINGNITPYPSDLKKASRAGEVRNRYASTANSRVHRTFDTRGLFFLAWEFLRMAP